MPTAGEIGTFWNDAEKQQPFPVKISLVHLYAVGLGFGGCYSPVNLAMSGEGKALAKLVRELYYCRSLDIFKKLPKRFPVILVASVLLGKARAVCR